MSPRAHCTALTVSLAAMLVVAVAALGAKPKTETFRARRPKVRIRREVLVALGESGDPGRASPGWTPSRWACPEVTIGAVNRTRKTMLAAALAGAAAFLSLGPASAQAALPAGNLIVNGDAETGPSGEGGQVFRPPGWTLSTDISQIKYGTGHAPSGDAADPVAHGATALFAGGPGTAVRTMGQVLALDDVAKAAIARGNVSATLSADLGGYASEADAVDVELSYGASAADVPARISVGPITRIDRNDETKLIRRTAKALLAADVAYMRVDVTFYPGTGSYMDGMADNLSVTLSAPGAPAPTPTPTASASPVPSPPPDAPAPRPLPSAGAVVRLAPPAVLGSDVRFDASASGNVGNYAWDLTGDGTADVDCGRQPRLTVGSGSPTISNRTPVKLAAAGTDGVTVAATVPTSALAVTRGPVVANFGTTAFCDGPPNFDALYDATARGGPPPGCNAQVVMDLAAAVGCLRRIKTAADPSLPAGAITALQDAYATDARLRTYVNQGAPRIAANTASVAQVRDKVLTKGPELDHAVDVAQFYASEFPARVNGLDFYPRPGTHVLVSGTLNVIILEGGVVKVQDAVVRRGAVVLDVSAARGVVPVGEVTLSGRTPTVGGFPVNPAMRITFARRGARRVANLSTTVALDATDAFGARDLVLEDGSPPVLPATVVLTNEEGFTSGELDGHLDRVYYGAWPITDVDVGLRPATPAAERCNLDAVDGADQWSFAGNLLLSGLERFGLRLTPPPLNGICFENGRFVSAGATLGPPILPLPIGPTGLFLDSVSANLRVHPVSVFTGKASISYAEVARVDGTIVAAFPNGKHPFTFLTAPAVPPLPASVKTAVFVDPVFAMGGDVYLQIPIIHDLLGDIHLAEAGFLFSTGGQLAFRGHIGDDFFGVVSYEGTFEGAMSTSRGTFNFTGDIEGCFLKKALCAGGIGVISSQGAGGCLEIGPVMIGGGLQWPDDPHFWPIDGCKWTRFTEEHVFADSARAAQTTAPYTVTIRRGDPSRVLQIDGKDRAPGVRVTGPDGETQTLTGDQPYVFGKHINVMRSLDHKLTAVGLQDPVPGKYTIEPLTGAWARVSVAEDVPDAKISARVTGEGPTRTLHYDIAKRPGQAVTFEDAGHVIGTVAGGGKGTLRFTALPGRHAIIARFALQGLPVPHETPIVARYRGSTRIGPAPPRGLKVTRSGTTLSARWRAAAGATRYAVVVRARGGAVRRLVTARRRLRITGVDATQAGHVTVCGLDRLNRRGASRTVSFKRVANPKTRFSAYSRHERD